MRIYNDRTGIRDDTTLRYRGDVAVMTARVVHECDTCPDLIQIGERYVFNIEQSRGGRYAEAERSHNHIACYRFSGDEYQLIQEEENR